MSANVSGPSVSLRAFGRQLSGSELHNGPAAAHNADVNVQLERCSCVPPYLELGCAASVLAGSLSTPHLLGSLPESPH